LPDAEAVCKRRKNVEGLLGNAPALGFGHVPEGAHIVQAVGKLDEYHAHVFTHGEEGLAERF
jgi:hypothetical protein